MQRALDETVLATCVLFANSARLSKPFKKLHNLIRTQKSNRRQIQQQYLLTKINRNNEIDMPVFCGGIRRRFSLAALELDCPRISKSEKMFVMNTNRQ